ncbi:MULTISPECIES: NAD/NADP transhydrogenase alpha subunit [Paenibacillus]|uniref:NAD/NADP transhydrogenase alpha subunit n=1 Tax=Paenibacillus campinasensis TaxID=66347 RepID=A0A268F360_9BACL|nr:MULTISPECIES: NAD/NADP transhydrogenase alpha subunit [Paenibacillus]MUG65076.1 NAD/NADP transhydrogenase alpha subunit [Paenibacillus campinasensis]PAD79783.1 NAD/NADP transhydrogenase alpha subunit [Paenibacillus campinasensis]PAK53648.1 NAD/NADP transhydrogenase alpha subunit [Paenibacillus sp. 7541]
MKCISVYTDNFALFSDIFEFVVESQSKLSENEEQEVEGVTFTHSGDAPEHYLERMVQKPEVVVMKDKSRGLTILQHGSVFEILIPTEESSLLS